MVDALTSTYTMPCPNRGEARVRLSAFREIEQLPGSLHPVLYRVVFACACGEQHPALLTHTDLDWAPLFSAGPEPECGGTFLNLMTGRHDDLTTELTAVVLHRLEAGEWPWSFFCYLEQRTRPITPSSFVVVAPGVGAGASPLGVAVRCPSCGSVSINVVTVSHVDLPFWHDASVGVVRHVFAADALRTIEAFQAELHSASFDQRRLALGP